VDERVRFAVLGPVTVSDGDRPRMIRGEMKRSVLAMLLLDANTVVSADRLLLSTARIEVHSPPTPPSG